MSESVSYKVKDMHYLGLYRKGLLTLLVEDKFRNKGQDVDITKKYGCLYQHTKKGCNNNG